MRADRAALWTRADRGIVSDACRSGPGALRSLYARSGYWRRDHRDHDV